MSSAAAERELQDLRYRFGQAATGLAAHAAVPVAVTPTLLNLIRTTFFLDPPEVLPYDIEAELLLSPAFHGIGSDLYEMDVGLRDLLLAELDVVYGPSRARQVAELLYSYSVEATPWAHSPRLDAAQQLTAYSFMDPDAAREALQQSATSDTGRGSDRTWHIAMEQRLERAADAAPSRFLDRAVEHARHDRWSGFVAEVDGAVERFPLDRTAAAAARALLRFGRQLPETRDSYIQYVIERLLELVELVKRQSPTYRYQLESLLPEATEQGRPVQEQWQALQRIEPLLELLGAPGEMAVTLELLHRYRDARAADPTLYFLVQICVDWVRCGLRRPIPERDLLDLTHDAIEEDLPHIDLTDDEMHEALRRARTPIARVGKVALLRTIRLAGQSRGYEVLDYLVAADDGQGARPRPVADTTWRRFLDRATDDEAFYIGIAADQRNNVPVAVSATRRAAEAGNVEAQYALGRLLAERLDPPDLDGARTWFTRAADAGAAESEAEAISHAMTKAKSSLTDLERQVSASWTPVQWSLRTVALRSDLNNLENRLRRLPDGWSLSGNTRQAILFKAEGNKVEQSSRNIKTRLDNLQDRSLPSERKAREFAAYVTASENLRSAIGRLQEILLTLEEAGAQSADVPFAQRPFHIEEVPLAADRFHVGDASGRAVGREDVLAWLRDRHATRGSAALLGPRRAGKSWVLAELSRRLRDDGATSVHEIVLPVPSSRIETSDALAALLDRSVAADASPGTALLDKARMSADTAEPMVFLLDEVGRLARYNLAVLSWLRDLGQAGAWLVYTGTQKDWHSVVRWATTAPGSSFGNDVYVRVLGPWDESTALTFICGTAANLAVDITPDKTGREIVKLVGTWPFYLQVVGDAVVRAVQAGDFRPLSDPSSLSRLVEYSLIDEWTSHFEGRWAEIGVAGKSALLAEPGAPPSSLTPAQRNELRATGLLRPGDRWLVDPPFFAWIARNAASLRDRDL